LLSLSQSAKLERKVTTVVVQTASQSCDAEGLAGCSADEEVDISILVFLNRCEVAVQRHVGIVVLKHSTGELFNLRKERSLPAHVMPSRSGGLDAAADRSVAHIRLCWAG
jgi:hypothetical protein